MPADIRVDKWLWTMRLFKTRSVAAEACKKGRVFINGVALKPSHLVRVGDVIQVKRSPVIFSYKIIDITNNRVGPKLVENFMTQVTSRDQLELLEMLKLDKANARAKGLGRPTKKERRSLDEFIDDTPFFVDDDDWDFDED